VIFGTAVKISTDAVRRAVHSWASCSYNARRLALR